MTSIRNQIKYGAMISYLSIAVHIVSALLYTPWMLSKIGNSDYGLYALASSLINMFLIDFGISSAVSRFLSKYYAEGEQEKANNFISLIYKLFFFISAVVCLALVVIYFFLDNIYNSLTPNELAKFKVVYIIAGSFNVISFPFSATLNGILTSSEKFIQMKLCDLANKVFTVIFIVLALLGGYGLYALVAINATLNLIIYGMKILIISKVTKLKIKASYFDKRLLKEVFGFSVWVMVNSICARLIMNICPSILGITVGTLAITIFNLASSLEGYAYSFASAIDGMFIPKIARITYRDNNIEELTNLMIKVGRFQFVLLGLIFIGFFSTGSEFVRLWLGSGYQEVYLCAILLLIPAPFYMSQQVGKTAMVVMNKVKYLSYIDIIKAVVNIIAVSVFSQFFGVVGACASICIVYIFRNVSFMLLYKNILNMNIVRFYKECYLKMCLPMLAVLAGSYSMRFWFVSENWLMFAAKVLLITIVYLVAMYVFALSPSEKSMLTGGLKKIFKNQVRI